MYSTHDLFLEISYCNCNCNCWTCLIFNDHVLNISLGFQNPNTVAERPSELKPQSLSEDFSYCQFPPCHQQRRNFYCKSIKVTMVRQFHKIPKLFRYTLQIFPLLKIQLLSCDPISSVLLLPQDIWFQAIVTSPN